MQIAPLLCRTHYSIEGEGLRTLDNMRRNLRISSYSIFYRGVFCNLWLPVLIHEQGLLLNSALQASDRLYNRTIIWRS